MDEQSVTLWLGQLKAGNPNAAQPLWDRYFLQLVRLARLQLSTRMRRVSDEEDVVLSAFASFCRAVNAGRFPRLDDRDDLWAVLVCLTERKAYALVDRERAVKRGGGTTRGDSIFPTDSESSPQLDVSAPDPTPAFAAEVAEEYERLLNRIAVHDPMLVEIAVRKLEGYSNAEIATSLGKSIATIERKLALIRSLWSVDDMNTITR